MSIAEWWWLADAKQAQATGSLTDDGWSDLYEFTYGGDDT